MCVCKEYNAKALDEQAHRMKTLREKKKKKKKKKQNKTKQLNN